MNADEPTDNVPSDPAELVAKCDELMGALTDAAKLTRETARHLGQCLSAVKTQTFKSNARAFDTWFTVRYQRTPQVASRWMRLATVWDVAQKNWEALPSDGREPWDSLSILDTIALARPARGKGDEDEKTPASDPAKMTSSQRLERIRQQDEMITALRQELADEEAEDAERYSLENIVRQIMSKGGKELRVKPGTVVRVGKETVRIDGPVILLPDVVPTQTTPTTAAN